MAQSGYTEEVKCALSPEGWVDILRKDRSFRTRGRLDMLKKKKKKTQFSTTTKNPERE